MKLIELEQTKGSLETLIVLLQEGNKRSTDLIELISPSRETFYKIMKKLKKYELITRQYDESQDALVWTLTARGKGIAEFLIEIEKKLNL